MERVRGRLLILAWALAGCLRDDPAPDRPPPPSTSVPTASAPAELEPSMPGPHRRRLEAAVALNATCVSCHDREAGEWRGSFHQRSDTDPAYRQAFAAEPTAFCQGCHAPESDPVREPPRAVSDLGVGCVTCHVTDDGAVLAAASSRAGAAPHPVRRSAAFSGSGACAGCHEFRFPAAHGDDDGDFMQTTAREHDRARSAATPCAACHMPIVDGRRSHAFAGVRDPAWLRENLRATAERVDDHRVRVTLVQPAGGHGFPTGDLFRRLEIGCELRGTGGGVLRREVRYLSRRFEIVPGKPGRHLAGDDRVFDGPAVVELSWERPARAPRSGVVSWWVSYQRVATVGTGTRPAEAKVESEVRLRSGELPWE